LSLSRYPLSQVTRAQNTKQHGPRNRTIIKPLIFSNQTSWCQSNDISNKKINLPWKNRVLTAKSR
jgi:hypothetical protein